MVVSQWVHNVGCQSFRHLSVARAFTSTPFRHRMRAEYEARMERLRQELARGADAHTQNISRHRLHIAENILTLKCPRRDCGAAILDFDG